MVKGVRGRLVDLCKPSARKYDLAVSVVLGRNIDAIVVDTEKTCIECIEVRTVFLTFYCTDGMSSTCGVSDPDKQHSSLSTPSKSSQSTIAYEVWQRELVLQSKSSYVILQSRELYIMLVGTLSFAIPWRLPGMFRMTAHRMSRVG